MSKYLKDQQRKFEDYAESYRRETNEVFRELVRQLIFTATVFLSISAFVFYIKDLIIKLNNIDKHLLMFSWILIGLSIVFGIIQFFIDYYFFRRWARAKFSVVESICSGEANERNLPQIAIKNQKDIPGDSSTYFVWLQVISLIIGITLFLVIISKLLFFA